MTPVRIRRAGEDDLPMLRALHVALWGEAGEAPRLDPDALALVADAPDATPIGFAEASVRRDYVNGCDTTPVAFLEALFVAPRWRRRGVARALVAEVAAWARRRGLGELASDAPLANRRSRALHRACGFTETERVVFFRRAL